MDLDLLRIASDIFHMTLIKDLHNDAIFELVEPQFLDLLALGSKLGCFWVVLLMWVHHQYTIK